VSVLQEKEEDGSFLHITSALRSRLSPICRGEFWR